MGFRIAKGMEFELIKYGALERSVMGSIINGYSKRGFTGSALP